MTSFQNTFITSCFDGYRGSVFSSRIRKMIAARNTDLQRAWSSLLIFSAFSILSNCLYVSFDGGVLNPRDIANRYSFSFNELYPLKVRENSASIESKDAMSEFVSSKYPRWILLNASGLFCVLWKELYESATTVMRAQASNKIVFIH